MARGGGSSCKGILGTELFTVSTVVLWMHEPVQVIYTCMNTHTPQVHTTNTQNSWGNLNKIGGLY